MLIECPPEFPVVSLQTTLLGLREAQPSLGIVDVVGAATTVLVVVTEPAKLTAIANDLQGNVFELAAGSDVGVHVFESIYSSDDLDEAAASQGMSAGALIEWHTASTWTAAFGGFAPGFFYLQGSQPRSFPRRAIPRTRVPAGSVALGGAYSAIYPLDSPGGWQLIGRVKESLWDTSRDQPALLQPGMSVQFRPVRAYTDLSRHQLPKSSENSARQPPPGSLPESQSSALKIISSGPQTTIQDLGRPGFAHLGVSASGAADRKALRLANSLVGNLASEHTTGRQTGLGLETDAPPLEANQPGAAALEILWGGLVIEAQGQLVIAVCGGAVTVTLTRTGGTSESYPLDTVIALDDGDRLAIEARPTQSNKSGMRSYLAVRGGINAEQTLGSRSTDTLSRIGPKVVAANDKIAVFYATRGVVGLPNGPSPEIHRGKQGTKQVTKQGTNHNVTLRFIPGPRDDFFTEASIAQFQAQTWTMSHDSNRLAIRFTCEPDSSSQATWQLFERSQDSPQELASEGLVIGAIQVPHSGLPVLFLADHPVTGGYPVIGVVIQADLNLAAQLRPGETVKFTAVQEPTELAKEKAPTA